MESGSPFGLKTLVILLCASTALCGIVLAPQPASAQAEEGVLRIAVAQDIPDFNIWNLGSNSEWKSDVIGFSFEGLVGLDYDLNPYPLLAESWTFDQFTLTYTFHLRHGVTFNDGMGTMTADDVVFMYKAAREGTTQTYSIINAFDANFDGLVSVLEINSAVTKVDDYTVQMTLPRPYGQFLTTTAGTYILPMRIWQNHLYGGTDPAAGATLDVSWGTDPAATVGTGPFRYKEGVASDHRTMEKYTGYWGKNFTTPLGYRLYPSNVNQLYFKCYEGFTSDAIQALKVGAIDYIDWRIPTGAVQDLQSDPDVSLSYLPDNAYFYLAFNEKLDPMGDISFRRAVSHLIDKNQIVNEYLEGYGIRGNACEPPFWGAGWYNVSVDYYPFSFTVAEQLLDSAGYVDVDADFLREMPDGSTMERITILTPPFEYDTVRSRAGQMIAKNMRQVGLDAVAIDIDFDTLVAKLQSMDYQMLIVGWSMSADPVGNVFDILGPMAASNTFGFWSLANPNPYYSSLGGVVTRADAPTQAAADEVLLLGNLARASFSTTDQQLYTKWAEGTIGWAVPVNVLFYRVNVEGCSADWSGWIPFLGTLFNIYAITNLADHGIHGVVPASNAVNVGLSMAEKVALGNWTKVSVQAINSAGNPISAASVSVTVTGYGGGPTVDPSLTSGMTNLSGTFETVLWGMSLGASVVSVSVSKLGNVGTAEEFIEVVKDRPTVLLLNVMSDTHIIGPGGTATLRFNVTNEYGISVAGASIYVDPNLVSYGSVADPVMLTDSFGQASTTYLAPSEFAPNSHLQVSLTFVAQKPGYDWAQSVATPILLYNPDPSDWSMVNVVSVSGTPALSSISNSTVIVLQALDSGGNALPAETLDVRYGEYGDESMLVSPVHSVITDGSGMAAISVQVKDNTPSMAFHVTARNSSRIDSVGASVAVTYLEPMMPTEKMYAGYITWFDGIADVPFMISMGMTTATAHVWNDTGEPANNVPAGVVVSATPYGTLATSDLVMTDSTWEGWGINIVTSADEMNVVTAGPMNTPFDYLNWQTWYDMGYIYAWDWGMMYGNNITNGVLDMMIYGVNVAPRDLISSIYVIPDSMGFFNGITLSYEIDGSTAIVSDLVIQRTFDIVVTDYSIDKPLLVSKTSEYDSTAVRAWVTDQSGSPVMGADVIVFESFRYYGRATDYRVYPELTPSSLYWRPDYVTTDSSGYATETVEAIGANYAVASSTTSPGIYVRGTFPGAYPIFPRTNLIIYVQQLLVTVDPVSSVINQGGSVPITARVTDIYGLPMQGVRVDLGASAGIVTPSSVLTGAAGIASFTLDTANVSVAAAGFIEVEARASAQAFYPASAKMMIAVRNPVVIDMELPVADAGVDQTIVEDSALTLDGSGSHDDVGVTNYTWTVVENGVHMYDVSPTRVFDTPGIYHIQLVVMDAAGNSSAADEMVVTVRDITPPDANAGTDQTVSAGAVCGFNGSGSSDNAGIDNYTWNFSDGSPKFLYNAKPTYVFNTIGTYTVTLNVSDAAGLYSEDVVVVTVVTDDVPPTANAGPDKLVNAGVQVSFNGAGSTDNVGIVQYTWTFTDVTPRTLSGMVASYTFATGGNYSVVLVVLDAEGNMGTDVVVIRVNGAPHANAGADFAVGAGGEVSFDASGSYDDKQIVNYTWTFTYQEVVQKLYGPSPKFTFEEPGTYSVELIVKDDAGMTSTDTISVTVSGKSLTSSLGQYWWAFVILAVVVLAVVLMFILRGRGAGGKPSESQAPPPPPENSL